MPVNDMTITLGGDAGQGIKSTGKGFCKAISRGGLFVFGRQDYKSRIRGGHNFFEIRIKDDQIHTHLGEIDLLIALTKDTIDKHVDEIKEGGAVIYEEDFEIDKKPLEERNISPFPVPLKKIAREEGGSEVMANTAAIGAAVGVTDYDLSFVERVIEENFKRKGEEIVENNKNVARSGYEFLGGEKKDFDPTLRPKEDPPERMTIDGNHAFSLGAIAGGCNFISAYPMTPSTSIFEALIEYGEEYEIVTKQTESELAAINMAIGASHVGARSLASTSGGGFSLMTESLGMAGMTETPLVIAEVQRPGPSTGLPTRTEQGDLGFVLNASQGEFPRVVLTPGTPKEYFEAGAEAFNIAEKLQTPVIVLSDQHLANSVRTIDIEEFSMKDAEIDRGKLLRQEELEETENYKRFEFTETGTSPRAVPGQENGVFTSTGNEHNEKGEISEDPGIRNRMTEKRMKKMQLARSGADGIEIYGKKGAETVFFGWGSSYGAIKEAVDKLNEGAHSIKFCHINRSCPLSEEKIKKIADEAEETVMIEGNHNAQMAQLIRQKTGKEMDFTITKYDGRPFSPSYVIENYEKTTGGN